MVSESVWKVESKEDEKKKSKGELELVIGSNKFTSVVDLSSTLSVVTLSFILTLIPVTSSQKALIIKPYHVICHFYKII